MSVNIKVKVSWQVVLELGQPQIFAPSGAVEYDHWALSIGIRIIMPGEFSLMALRNGIVRSSADGSRRQRDLHYPRAGLCNKRERIPALLLHIWRGRMSHDDSHSTI
jgi:hypothetical protein